MASEPQQPMMFIDSTSREPTLEDFVAQYPVACSGCWSLYGPLPQAHVCRQKRHEGLVFSRVIPDWVWLQVLSCSDTVSAFEIKV